MHNVKDHKILTEWYDESLILEQWASVEFDSARVREILNKAETLQRLSAAEVAILMNVETPTLLEEIFYAARILKEKIYGRRIVLFAPLYISNICSNNCAYCAFRAESKIERRSLTTAQVVQETEALIRQGHKRLLLVAGEDASLKNLDYVIEAINAVYSVSVENGKIRRVNVNIAPLDVKQFQHLKTANIGTYQLFQETYHQPTYENVHISGPKRDFFWRLNAMDRAMEAGIDDVGIGALFGLYDWKFEVLAMMQHIEHLEKKFGIGPHTISVPRIEPAEGSCFSLQPPHPVSDHDFLKMVAILRLAVPYTGIIMSTREDSVMRKQTLSHGVSQISAGSRINIGGYSLGDMNAPGQFQIGDHRCLEEVVNDLAHMGYIPSFCTACYRMGRTGRDFMDLAKPGDIKMHCDPNAVLSLMEYLLDYASPETSEIGSRLIKKSVDSMHETIQVATNGMLDQIKNGKRNIFV